MFNKALSLINFFLSFIYYFLYKIVVFCYKKNIFKTYDSKNIFIVGVGNLSMGGSGKTPFIKLLADCLTKHKKKHCIITRGYKKKNNQTFYVDNNNLSSFSPEIIGDEPFMLSRELEKTPMIVGNKIKGLQIAENKKKFLYALIDDGFQTFSIKKNYNVLLLDFSVSLKN